MPALKLAPSAAPIASSIEGSSAVTLDDGAVGSGAAGGEGGEGEGGGGSGGGARGGGEGVGDGGGSVLPLAAAALQRAHALHLHLRQLDAGLLGHQLKQCS